MTIALTGATGFVGQAVLAEALSAGASTRDAADEAARRLGVSRRRAYRLALE